MKPEGRREAIEGLASGFYVQALLLVTGIVAARILGPDERGQLALIWIVVLTLVQLGTLGLPLAVTFEIATGSRVGTLLRVLRPVVVAQVATAIVLYGVLAVIVLEGRVPETPILIAAAVIPAWLVQGYVLAALQGKHAFRPLHVMRVLAMSLYTAFLVLGVLAGQSSLLFVTGAWVVAYVLAGFGSFFVVVRMLAREAREAREGAEQKPPALGSMLRFGLSGFLGSVSPTETFRVDQLVVGLALSTQDLGLYVAALAFCNLPRFMAQGLGLVAYPRIAAEADRAIQRRMLWRFAGLGTLAALVVALPLVAFDDELMTLAFGDAFAGAATTMQILVLGTVVLCARRMLSDGLRGAGAPGAGSLAEVVALIALVPAILLLAPPYGLEGIAVALAISYAVSLGVLLLALERQGLGVINRRHQSP